MMVPTPHLSNREYYSNQGMDWQDSTNDARPLSNEQQFPFPASTPTDDLLGFDEVSMPHHHPQRLQQQHMQTPTQSIQQQQPQQQVFNAAQATISITTMNATAPSIAGLGKIEPSSARSSSKEQQIKAAKRKVIYVPTYSCNGGLDTKFNHFARHAKPSHLHGLLTSAEYEREISMLNDEIKKARAKSLDVALLATGPLLLPLAVWGARHGKQVKRKRTLIEKGVSEFNERMSMDGRNLQMVWNRAGYVGGGESFLTIEECDLEEEDGRGGRKKVD